MFAIQSRRNVMLHGLVIMCLLFNTLVGGLVLPARAQEADSTATQIETATETPTSDFDLTTPTPTATETPVESPTDPVATLPGSETPTATPLPTETSTPEITLTEVIPAYTLTLSSDPTFLIGAGIVQLSWLIEGELRTTLPLSLEVRLPAGFQPQLAGADDRFDPVNGLFTTAVTSARGSVTLHVEVLGGDALIEGRLFNEVDTLAIAELNLPLYERFEVSASGGSAEIREGKIRITFPAGALREDIVLNAGTPTARAGAEGGFSATAFELTAMARNRGTAEIRQFDAPVTIEVDYSDLNLDENQEEYLYLHWYNETTGEWHSLESYRDPNAKILRAYTTHFTVFDIGVNDWRAERLPTVDAFQVSKFTGAGSFSLPIEVPAGPGGFQPNITLAYNSQVVDQSTKKAQASWVGMGWSLDGGGGSITENSDGSGYQLDVNGVSTQLIQEAADGRYHAMEQNFWKITRDTTADTWTVFDTQGNVYLFSTKARTSWYNPETWNYEQKVYAWYLTTATSARGQTISYAYHKQQRNFNNILTDTAVYIETITYGKVNATDGQTQVQFVRDAEARTDYPAAYDDPEEAAVHMYQKRRLDQIIIKRDNNGDDTYDTFIRKYQFTYVGESGADPANQIWPGITYSAGDDLTLTLRSVQEWSNFNGTDWLDSLPPYTFSYGDNLHLTSATNGYGGKVVFTYEATPWSSTITPNNYVVNDSSCGGWTTHNGTATCNSSTGEMTVVDGAVSKQYPNGTGFPVRPGGAYEVTFTGSKTSGSSVYVGIMYKGSSAYKQINPNNGFNYTVIPLDEEAFTARPFFMTTGTGKFTNVQIKLLTSIYRVTQKTIFDGQGNSYTTQYEYETPKVLAADYEFRGHLYVTEIAPDGTRVRTQFYQDDARKGRVRQVEVFLANSNTLISRTINTHGKTALPEYPVSNKYEHAWVHLDSEATYIYDNNGFQIGGTSTVYTYASTYGNLIRKDEYANPDGTGIPYRTTTITYTAPKSNSTTYIVSAVARVQVSKGDGTPLTDTLNFYDNSTTNGAAPNKNILTMVRTWMRGTDYAQTNYAYDATYGNQTSVTTYTGYGTATTNPSTPALITSTIYDSTYHAYPIQTTNPLGYVSLVDYDYAHGKPLCATELLPSASGVTCVTTPGHTSAEYDSFGRIIAIIRPGDSSASPTLSMGYAQDPVDLNLTVTITQKVNDTPQFYTITREYDGFGREILTNAGGVFTKNEYPTATITKQSMPYLSGETPQFTTTTVNPATRTTTVTAPDGTYSTSQSDGFTTTTAQYNANGTLFNDHTTVTTSDIWGRTIFVAPPTGPSIQSAYDELNRLVSTSRGAGQAPPVTLPSSADPGVVNLSAWWRMDETTGNRVDSHGTNTLTNNGSVAYVSGLKGNAASFVGNSAQSLSINDNANVSVGDLDFSLVAHVYLNSASGTYVIVDKSSGSTVEYRLAYNPASGFQFVVGSGQVDSGPVQANTWYTIVAWHDSVNDTLNIKLNDSGSNSINHTGGTTDGTGVVRIGAASDTTAPFNGDVDEVGLYKRTLTLAEQAWFYNNGSGHSYSDLTLNPGTANLSAWWRMEETSGTHNDSHGTNHLNNTGSVSYAAGLQGNAASFTGSSSQYLSKSDNASLSTGNIRFTVVAHVYLNSVSGSLAILDKSSNDASTIEYRLAHNAGTGFRFRVGSGQVDSGPVSANTWYTVVSWHDSVNDTLNIQVNNGPVSTVNYSNGTTDTNYAMRVGLTLGGSSPMNGRVDEVAIIKRLLTQPERAWFFNTGLGRTYADLTASAPPPPANSNPTTTFTYDNAGRKITMSDPNMGIWSYDYDALGNLLRQTDARGQRICLYYDTLNRLTGKYYHTTDTCPTSPTYNVSYTYDQGTNGLGRRTGMSDLISGSTIWTYDTRGRMTSESKNLTSAGTFLTAWTYNAADLPLTMTYPGGSGGQAGETVTYGYNSRMLLNSVIGTKTYVNSTTYDAAGRMDLRMFGNGTQTNYDYYAWSAQGGRLQTLQSGSTGTPTSLQNLTYTYDTGGNISTILDSLAGPQTQTFGYDPLDRLTSAYTTGGSVGQYNETYTYDSTTGNLATKAGASLTYNAQLSACGASNRTIPHAVSAMSGNNYGYDCNGNQTVRDINSGTLAGDYVLLYDAENRLVEVQKNSVTLATFVYDGDGRQVKSVVSGITTLFVGAHYQVENGLETKYYFAGATRIALRKNGTLSYLLGDHLGSTSLTTSVSGTLVSELRYLPWGETRYSSGTTPTNYKYTGQREESGFGLYFYNARWYDPYLGRFAQADTIVPGGVQGLDRYAYVNNSPLSYTDPTGHWGWSASFNFSNSISAPLNHLFGSGASQRAATMLDKAGTALDAAALAIDMAVVAADVTAAAVGATSGAAIAAPGGEAPVVVTGPLGAGVGVAAVEIAAKPLVALANGLATISTAFTLGSDVLTGDTNYSVSLSVGSDGVEYNEQLVIGTDTYTSAALTTIGWGMPTAFMSAPFQAAAFANDVGLLYDPSTYNILGNVITSNPQAGLPAKLTGYALILASQYVSPPPPLLLRDRHFSIGFSQAE